MVENFLFYFVSPRSPARRRVSRCGGSRPVAAATAGVIIRIVLWNNALLAAVISIHAATPGTIYRIELSGNQIVWSEDLPRDSGAARPLSPLPGRHARERQEGRRAARRGRPSGDRSPQEPAVGTRHHDRDPRRPDGIGIRRGEGLPGGNRAASRRAASRRGQGWDCPLESRPSLPPRMGLHSECPDRIFRSPIPPTTTERARHSPTRPPAPSRKLRVSLPRCRRAAASRPRPHSN